MPSFSRLPQRWVLPLAMLVLLVSMIILEVPIMSYTKGALMYPMDDAFIHMSVAKNIALHGVWGVSKYEFVSASSSILYPPILAFFFLITGPNVFIPLFVNLVAGILFLIVIQRWLRRQDISPLHQLLILLATTVLIPLPYIIRLGMEHTLQILFSFLFIYEFSGWLTQKIQSGARKWEIPWQILGYAALVTAIRYEGMFLIMIAGLFLLYYRQIRSAFELGLVAAIPIILFGIYSVYKGNYFLPSPVLLKSAPVPLTPTGLLDFLTVGIFQKLYYFYATSSNVAVQRLVFLLPGVSLIFWRQLKQEIYYRHILIFLTAASFLHLVFANTNWFYRYEAYLIGSSVLITGVLFAKFGIRQISKITTRQWCLGIIAAIVLSYPFLLRSKEAYDITKPACLNLYDQDYHVSQFLHKYYDSTRIGFNDLGCITYYTSAKSLDLVGLGNIDVARSRRNNYYNSVFIDSLIRQEKIKMVVVFDRKLGTALLHKWKKVATWHFDHIIIAGDQDYSFYAMDTTLAPGLKQNLIAYRKFLPPGVTLRY